MIDIDGVLRELVSRRGSDLHLKIGRPPLMRISSELLPSEFPPLPEAELDAVLRKILGADGHARLQEDGEFDGSYEIASVARFRVNAFKERGRYGVVMRVIPLTVPTLDGLGHPAVLKDICQAPQGLVLVTGPTGSGKSTTLAAMINHINEHQPLHIVTVEDPIEFIYSDKKCTIRQRQLGTDVRSLAEALRRVLRQDPDVILVGEMRDRETIDLALHAAETGHLVFSTLHTNDAKQTLDRIIDVFPAEEHQQIRAQLALCLQAVISQRLVRRADGGGRTAAMEVMINSPQIRDLIAEGKTSSMEKAIATSGDYYRMQTFNQSLARLAQDKVITQEEALAASTNPGDLKLMLKGVTGGTAVVRPSSDAKPAMKITRGF
ncbi:MAG TPA: type IV pilus twitching motility protein PilT [Planctomycetota bacterium]|nr:type IV pilus twitching motility protein PilT [Planctomycetota bacterium]